MTRRWQYRIGVMTEGSQKIYGVIEYYPKWRGPGDPWSGFMRPQGETVEGLREELVAMLNDTYRDEPPIELTPTTRLVKVGQAAKILGIHPNTVRRWQKQGVLKAARVGLRGDRRFVRSEVEKLMKEMGL